MFPKILRESAPSDGGDQPQANPPAPAPDPARPAAEPPPAASVIKTGEVTEDVLALRRKNEELEARAKKAETDASTLQDENFRLKQAGIKPPAPAPVEDKRSALERFMAGEDV